jgi:hypothetical protein
MSIVKQMEEEETARVDSFKKLQSSVWMESKLWRAF